MSLLENISVNFWQNLFQNAFSKNRDSHTKNFILKFRRYPETLWEIIFPLFCGIIAGILSVEPTDVKGDTPLELFQAISMVYFAAYFIITISFLGSVIFLLHELIHERETRIYETMKLMSMTRSTYTLSYFLT